MCSFIQCNDNIISYIDQIMFHLYLLVMFTKLKIDMKQFMIHLHSTSTGTCADEVLLTFLFQFTRWVGGTADGQQKY